MNSKLLIASLISFCTLFFGCAINPPIITLPEFGHYEKSHIQAEADKSFIQEIRKAQQKDSTLDPVKYFIDNGFNALKQGEYELAVQRFNHAWLLDSLIPDIYLGFAIADLQDNNAKSAIQYYEKYRRLAQERPTLRTQDTLVAAEPIRSNIANALSVGDRDSIRIYLNKAKELELFYGSSVLSDFEYVQIASLDVDAFADTILWKKAKRLQNSTGYNRTYKDTLELLAIYRSYPHIFSKNFYSQTRKYPEGHYLIKATRRPFLNTSKIILDNRIASRFFLGPTIRFYDDKSAEVLGSKAVGASADLEFCFLYGCLGFGGGATAPIGHKTKFIYKDQEYQRSSSDADGSIFVHLGGRTLLRESFDIELYGLMNVSLYATNKENSQTVAALDFGFGIAYTSALFTFHPLVAPKEQANFNFRIKADYLWNRTPSKCQGPDGHVLALSIQFGIGGSSYRFEEESNNPQGRSFSEEWARLGDPTPNNTTNMPPNNYRRVYPRH